MTCLSLAPGETGGPDTDDVSEFASFLKATMDGDERVRAWWQAHHPEVICRNLAMPPNLLTRLLEAEETKPVTPLPTWPVGVEAACHLYASVGRKQSRPTQATSYNQPPSHGPQDQGYRIVSLPPHPSVHPPVL